MRLVVGYDPGIRSSTSIVCMEVDEGPPRMVWMTEVQDRLPRPLVQRMHGSRFAKAFSFDGPATWRPRRVRFATLRRLLYSGVRDGLGRVSKARVTRFDSGAPGEVR